MSYENPISIIKNSAGEKSRILKLEKVHQKYDIYLRNLIERMIDDDPKLRPNSSDAYDELEVIEIFKTKPNNKILKKSLDELNSELERKKKENKQNKNFKKMNTDMDIKYKNDIKTENKAQINSGIKPSKEKEFISSNSIYSNPNKNSNVPQSCQAYNSIPTNPNYIANHSLNNSGIAGNYPDINHNFYHTQNNFRRSYVPQIPQIMPPPPSVEIKQKKSPKGIKKVLNKFAGFLLNEK
jgi:hypothetical protein